MKQLSILLTIFILCANSLFATPNEIVKEERKLAPFTGIEVTKLVELNIVEGVEFSVVVEAEEEVVSSVVTEVKNQVLKLTIDDKYKVLKFNKSQVIIHITLPKLAYLNANTGSRVWATSDFTTNDLNIVVSSNAEVRFDKGITAERIDINANSGGKFSIKGKTTANSAKFLAASKSEISLNLELENNIDCGATGNSRITINGKANTAKLYTTTSSELRMRSFEVQTANVVATTNSIIQITVKEFLAATATNGAMISYSGKPKSVNKEATTGGRIR